jgi:hypothetical protein
MTLNKKLLVGAGIGLAVAAAAFALSYSGKSGRYAAFDLNGDNAVALTEVREIGQRRFAVLDVDSNGAIAGAELPLMLHGSDQRGGGLGGPVSRPDDRRALAADSADSAAPQIGSGDTGGEVPQALASLPMDYNGDGAIQGNEYVAGFTAPFALRDIDGDGTLADEELRSGRHERGERRGQRH